MRFDARAAKALQPGQHMIVEGCPGLRLVATDSKRTWTYRYKSPVDGRMRQHALGTWPAMSPAGAAGAWSVLRDQRDSGIDPAQQRRAARQAEIITRQRRTNVYTVGALVQDYLDGHIAHHRNAKGAAEVTRLFGRLLGDLADVTAEKLTRAQAFGLIESLAGTPVQAKMLKQELGGAWDYALDAGRLPETAPNWWRLVMRGRLRSKGAVAQGRHKGTAKRVLSQPELGELVRWLPNFTRLVEDALTLYLWTGTRGAEILGMEAHEIATEADKVLWWTIPKVKTKNARHEHATDLRVPLVGRAREVVLRRLQLYPTGYLFPAAVTARLHPNVQQKTIGVAVWSAMPYSKSHPGWQRARLTVTHWSPHDLRRSVRTLLAAMGCERDVAESVLGHMLPGVEGVYNKHSYDAERLLWLTRLSERLEQLAAA